MRPILSTNGMIDDFLYTVFFVKKFFHICELFIRSSNTYIYTMLKPHTNKKCAPIYLQGIRGPSTPISSTLIA